MLALGLPGAPSAGAAITPCTTPPAITPESSLTDGTMGTGWTTVKGRTPVSFDVEVLGIQPDGIAPGIDFILVQVSGPVIDTTSGIAEGFSGSPVYVGGKLAGAISYTFYYGDHTIGGMTPAQPMVDLLDYPAPTSASVPMAKSVHLSKRMRAAAATAAGVSAESFASTAKKIPTPFAASGLAATNQLDLQGLLDKHGMNATAYAAGSAPRPTSSTLSTTPLQPGQPFAEVLSYGTITFAGVGMTTIVCGDYAVAFGHAFNLKGGGISNGENAADILTVVPDPSGLVGGFDVAQIAEPIGAIDQDRLAGIRGVQGVMVHTLPITSDVVNLDTGRELVRESDVVASGYWPRYVAYYHVYENLLGALDARSGTVNIHWTITGKANGDQFTLNRDNEYSGGGFFYDAAYELYSEMRSLQNNEFGHAKLTSIDVSATVTEAKDLAAIRRARTGSSTRAPRPPPPPPGGAGRHDPGPGPDRAARRVADRAREPVDPGPEHRDRQRPARDRERLPALLHQGRHDPAGGQAARERSAYLRPGHRAEDGRDEDAPVPAPAGLGPRAEPDQRQDRPRVVGR